MTLRVWVKVRAFAMKFLMGVPACSLDAYERVVDAIFSMPGDLLNQDEVPGTPNSLQVPLGLLFRSH